MPRGCPRAASRCPPLRSRPAPRVESAEPLACRERSPCPHRLNREYATRVRPVNTLPAARKHAPPPRDTRYDPFMRRSALFFSALAASAFTTLGARAQEAAVVADPDLVETSLGPPAAPPPLDIPYVQYG